MYILAHHDYARQFRQALMPHTIAMEQVSHAKVPELPVTPRLYQIGSPSVGSPAQAQPDR